jgi:formate/nitrite transporter FocA (FNT family)
MMALKRAAVFVVGMAVGAAFTFGIVLLLQMRAEDPLLLQKFGPLNFVLATFMFGMIAVVYLDAILKTEILK